MVNRFVVDARGDGAYALPRDPEGAFVLYSDYKLLEDKYKALQQVHSELHSKIAGITDTYNINPDYFFDVHD